MPLYRQLTKIEGGDYGSDSEARARQAPKHGEAMSGADRQVLYAKARQRDMAGVAYALKDVLARTRANQKAFSDSYQGTTSGDRLRRGLAHLLADDPVTMAFFDELIPSVDEK